MRTRTDVKNHLLNGSYYQTYPFSELTKQIRIARRHAKAFAIIARGLEKTIEERRQNFHEHEDNTRPV